MTRRAIASSSTTHISEKDKLKRESFARLAMVGRAKKEASRYRDEAEFFSLIAIEALAILEELRKAVASTAASPEQMLAAVDAESAQRALTMRLLDSWPQNSESQSRFSKVLTSGGLVRVMTITDDGYLSLSMDPILENVATVIEAIKEQSLRV